MKKTKLAALMATAMMALAPFSSGQDRFQAALDFLVASPQGDFRTQVDRTFYGLSGEFLYRLPRSPLSFGVSLEYLNYGSETRTEPWSADVPEVWVDVTTRNSIVTGAALLRLSPAGGAFRPYVEGLIGFNYLFTYTSLKDADAWSEDISTTTNYDDWALTYGAGAGVVFRALDIRREEGKSVFSLYLEVGLRYLRGGTAEYHRKGTFLDDHGPLTSTTDLVKSKLGFVLYF